jgi:hypothetical protein
MLLSVANQALVAQMYPDLLQRPADAGGLANWSAALDQGVRPAQVALNLAQSPEARALQVQTLYQQFLHRGADSAGLDGFSQALAAGQTLEQVAAALATSPEYYQNRGSGTDSGFLNALYQDALSRQVDAGGAATYAQALASGTTRGQVIQAIFASAELQQDMVQHDYQNFLHRAADAAGLANWTGAMQHGMRDEQIAAAMIGSPEYAQNVHSAGGSLQQTLLPDSGYGLPVLVTNTPSQPVPVQLTGPWTVGISGSVQVASSLTNPVFVRNVNDAVQPFQSNAQTINVPAGKRLVIEDVSGYADGSGLTGGWFKVRTSVSGSVTQHYIPASFAYAGVGSNYVVGHEQVRLYADLGTTVDVAFQGNVAATLDNFTISGYLVNVP